MVLNISQWQEIDLKVLGELHLDDQNVRLENSDSKVEADLLQDLFANENVLELVSRIASIGFLTHELPIAVKRRNKYVVVEGNRRIAALKAIQNPMLVPAYQARVKDITSVILKAQLKTLASVRVKVAPNPEQANQLIAALHTGGDRRRWTPARQAAFFQAQIDAGRTYDELVDRYPTVEVGKFVFRSHVLRLIRDTIFDDAELNDFVSSPEWRRSSSTIERIYDTRDFIDLTGMRMDKGTFKHDLSPVQVKAVATVIVRGMKEKSLNTRTINRVDTPRFRQLMSDLRQAVGVPALGPTDGGGGGGAAGGAAGGPGGGSAGGGGGGKSGSGSRGGGTGGKKTGAGKGTPTPKAKNFLHVSLSVPASYSLALHKQYEELSILDYQRMPNTAYLALRAVLEKSIKQYAEAQGVDIATAVNTKGAYVQLHHALAWLEDHVTANGPKPLLQPLKKVRTGKSVNYGSNYSSTKDAMDAANHNHTFLVSPSEVLDLWDSIEPLLRELLTP